MTASSAKPECCRNIAERVAVATGVRERLAAAMAPLGMVLIAVFLVLGTIAPALAQSSQEDIFTVRGVPVDATARSTTDARSLALARGQEDALMRLFRRLVPRAYQDRLPDLPNEDVVELVRDFSIANERTSPVRYLADLTVRFDSEAIRATLRFADIPFAETVSRPVVVVPAFQESVVSDPVIWSDGNLWRQAWDRLAPTEGLVPRQLPLGDLEDMMAVTVSDAMARDAAALQVLADRYDASEAVVAFATRIGGIGRESVQVTLYSSRTGEEQRIDVPASGGQTWAELFEAAAREAWSVVEDNWKRENMLRFGETGQITALVPLGNLEDWLFVRERLSRVPLIDRFDLQAITRDRAQVTLYFLGDEEQLTLAMAQSDLGLNVRNAVWMIERQGDAQFEPPQRVIGQSQDSRAPVLTPPSGVSPMSQSRRQVLPAPPVDDSPYPSGGLFGGNPRP